MKLNIRKHPRFQPTIKAIPPTPPVTTIKIEENTYDILVKFPTRSRPKKFWETFTKWQELQSSGKVHFLICIDSDDSATLEDIELLNNLAKLENTKIHIGNHASKIDAFNCSINAQNFDILVLASDDMIPHAQDWDKIIGSDMRLHFPNLDGALHYPDGHTDLMTLSIMGKRLYQKLGYAYHPDYRNLWCDNEFTEVTKQLDKYQLIKKKLVHT